MTESKAKTVPITGTVAFKVREGRDAKKAGFEVDPFHPELCVGWDGQDCWRCGLIGNRGPWRRDQKMVS